MDIVEPVKRALLTVGASPVMWLLLWLSMASVAVILERAWIFARARVDIEALGSSFALYLSANDMAGAEQLLNESRSVEAAIVRAGLQQSARGEAAVRKATASAKLLYRARLERGLNFLGTLASNAPFIGLFGTVIGIILAFHELSLSDVPGATSAAVMASIAEALVATAVGIGVAVPAVVAFNGFQARIRSILDRAEALEHVLVLHLEER